MLKKEDLQKREMELEHELNLMSQQIQMLNRQRDDMKAALCSKRNARAPKPKCFDFQEISNSNNTPQPADHDQERKQGPIDDVDRFLSLFDELERKSKAKGDLSNNVCSFMGDLKKEMGEVQEQSVTYNRHEQKGKGENRENPASNVQATHFQVSQPSYYEAPCQPRPSLITPNHDDLLEIKLSLQKWSNRIKKDLKEKNSALKREIDEVRSDRDGRVEELKNARSTISDLQQERFVMCRALSKRNAQWSEAQRMAKEVDEKVCGLQQENEGLKKDLRDKKELIKAMMDSVQMFEDHHRKVIQGLSKSRSDRQ